MLAQVGMHIPARSCELTPFDAILTRVGAHDNMLSGQSTFMVELVSSLVDITFIDPLFLFSLKLQMFYVKQRLLLL